MRLLVDTGRRRIHADFEVLDVTVEHVRDDGSLTVRVRAVSTLEEFDVHAPRPANRGCSYGSRMSMSSSRRRGRLRADGFLPTSAKCRLKSRSPDRCGHSPNQHWMSWTRETRSGRRTGMRMRRGPKATPTLQ